LAERDLVLIVLGTRPEAIKFLPVIRAFSSEPRLRLGVVTTGQHREMVEQILGPFGVRPDYDLDIMRPDQSLNDIVCGVIPRLERLYLDLAPRLVLVQGDTTSAFAAGLAAFHRRILVGHVEAGLRSYDRHHPYPEESNRRMLSSVADLHLAATPSAAANLFREGIPREDVVVTGNTVIDGLLETLSRPDLLEKHRIRDLVPAPGEPLVLMTLHRRENWMRPPGGGASPLENVLSAVATAAAEFPGVRFVYPVHPNPNVQEPARRLLGGLPNVRLTAPLPHLPFVDLLSRATVVLTDSGGIQEECPSLGVPVLVTRKTTERPEAVDAGYNQLVGTEPAEVLAALQARLRKPARRPGTPPLPNPYGDGRASDRIRRAVLHRLGYDERPGDFESAVLARSQVPGSRRADSVAEGESA
jgi:UDP-N-acetylglucosamine 2-epimerase (non-hydrolysing)